MGKLNMFVSGAAFTAAIVFIIIEYYLFSAIGIIIFLINLFLGLILE